MALGWFITGQLAASILKIIEAFGDEQDSDEQSSNELS